MWKKDLNIKQANALLKKEAEKAKNSPHEKKGNQLIRFGGGIGPDGLGSALVTYPNAYSESRLNRLYVINRMPKSVPDFEQRVYYYEEQVVNIQSYIDDTNTFLIYMTTNIGPSDPSLAFQIVEGSYFDGGFLVGPSNIPWPQREEIGVEVTFPEYPGIEFSIFFDHMQIDTDPLFGQIGRFAKGSDVLRKDNTTLWRNPAQEVLGKFTKNGITHYSFTLNSPSKKDKMDVPLVLMHLQNPTGGVMRNGVSTITPPLLAHLSVPIKKPLHFGTQYAKAYVGDLIIEL